MNFFITESAANRIKRLLQDEPIGSFFRIKVEGGGCSGFQYNYSFDTQSKLSDIFFGTKESRIVIDDLSIGFLDNATIDYVEDLSGSKFEIKNPNTSAKCGCGASFSI